MEEKSTAALTDVSFAARRFRCWNVCGRTPPRTISATRASSSSKACAACSTTASRTSRETIARAHTSPSNKWQSPISSSCSSSRPCARNWRGAWPTRQTRYSTSTISQRKSANFCVTPTIASFPVRQASGLSIPTHRITHQAQVAQASRPARRPTLKTTAGYYRTPRWP